MLKILGTNTNKNDWNHIEHQAGLNAWIGKLADGTIATVQTMPWDYKPWGCGSGTKGSCNNGWIQFEICEDGLTDKNYFNKVYQEACELTAYLCDLFNINPSGTVDVNGIKVPTILCHADSYKLGLGSNHGDVLHWFSKYNKDMEDVRKDVTKLMGKKENKPVDDNESKKEEKQNDLKIGDAVSLLLGSTYTSGKSIPSWVFNSKLYIRKFQKDGTEAIISTHKTGSVTGIVATEDLIPYGTSQVAEGFEPYYVKINTDVLNVRAGAGTSYKITTQVTKNQIFTIIDERDGWGKLKSGAGWISLDYTIRLK